MRAFAVFPESGQARVIDVDEPQVTTSDEVKLRVLDVGICGTDREIAAGDYGTPPAWVGYAGVARRGPLPNHPPLASGGSRSPADRAGTGH